MHNRPAWPQAPVRHSILNQSGLRWVRLCDGYVIRRSGADMVGLAKRANPAADTTELEREIDGLVYQLYGLTPDEIKLAEEIAKR